VATPGDALHVIGALCKGINVIQHQLTTDDKFLAPWFVFDPDQVALRWLIAVNRAQGISVEAHDTTLRDSPELAAPVADCVAALEAARGKPDLGQVIEAAVLDLVHIVAAFYCFFTAQCMSLNDGHPGAVQHISFLTTNCRVGGDPDTFDAILQNISILIPAVNRLNAPAQATFMDAYENIDPADRAKYIEVYAEA
jgi:hypothetical protein